MKNNLYYPQVSISDDQIFTEIKKEREIIVYFALPYLYKTLLKVFIELFKIQNINKNVGVKKSKKIARFDRQKNFFYKKHKEIFKNGDPYYNSNLTLDREDFGLK